MNILENIKYYAATSESRIAIDVYKRQPSGSATLSLTGDLASDTSAKTKIGVVTVTLVNE